MGASDSPSDLGKAVEVPSVVLEPMFEHFHVIGLALPSSHKPGAGFELNAWFDPTAFLELRQRCLNDLARGRRQPAVNALLSLPGKRSAHQVGTDRWRD